ncbi:MAG: sodium/hydrogen exchanger [Verrucomicrobiales bacterium]|nr:sodium/hydrogen exchanger [Verrucomicrobiales bacterium]
MHTIAFLQDLAAVMIVAGLVTILFHRFKQPVVLGYILAGFIIGPHTPPFSLITSEESINTLAEIGVILLMFSLGLEFSLRKLKKVGGTAVIAALLEILVMGWVGYELGRLFKWSNSDSLFLGAMLSMSSTTIIIKVLAELGRTKDSFAQLIFGILIIEDILGIVMIALLSGIATTGSLSAGTVGVTLGKLSVFLVVILVVGLITVPRLIGYVAKFKSNEMLLITTLGLCFGVSLLAAKVGYSVALGAFIIGAIIAEAREIHRIETLIEPVRDMFSAVFFVAIGLLIEPHMLMTHWMPILVITLAVVCCKVIACATGTFLGGYDSQTSLRVGMSVAQIGEFSFIIASLGVTLKVTSEFLYPIAVAVSAITTLLTPYLIRSADGVVVRFNRSAPRSLVHSMSLYTQWIGKLGHRSQPGLAAKLTRRWILQMALNVALMTGIFIAADYLARENPGWLKKLNWSEESVNTALWLVAVIMSLPLFIATSRKLGALGLLIAETRVTQAAAGERTAAIRSVVAQVIPIAGTAVLGFYVLVLTSALLPGLEVLMVLLLLVALVAWLLRRSFIKVYSQAQAALQETFAQPPPETQAEVMAVLPALFRDAHLETCEITSTSPAGGKLIHELKLRTLTGASIVGIERNGRSIINPSPDEELQCGDKVLLLGSSRQLEASCKILK